VIDRDPEDALARFFASQEDAPDRADAALREVLEVAPRRAPTAALSDRLMQMAALQASAAARGSERLVAAGVVAAAFGMTVLPVAVVVALVVFDAARLVSWIARGCVWITDWLNAGVSVWTLLARSGGALGYAANSPMGSAALTITLLVASMALLVLNRYLPTERS
jgi:hypothetical protein